MRGIVDAEKVVMEMMPFPLEKNSGKMGRPRKPVSKSQRLEQQQKSLQQKFQWNGKKNLLGKLEENRVPEHRSLMVLESMINSFEFKKRATDNSAQGHSLNPATSRVWVTLVRVVSAEWLSLTSVKWAMKTKDWFSGLFWKNWMRKEKGADPRKTLWLLSVLFGMSCLVYCCSVTKSCSTLCSLVGCSMPGTSVLDYLPESAQIHVHWVSAAIHPSHPLSTCFSSCLQSFPASGSFPVSWLFKSDSQSIGVSASSPSNHSTSLTGSSQKSDELRVWKWHNCVHHLFFV